MYLTKSRFKTGLSCPTKLCYETNPLDFVNHDDVNEFVQGKL